MIKLITVGTIKEKYLKDAIDEYTKRIKKYTNIELIEVKDEGLVEPTKSIILEEEKILKHINDKDYIGMSKESSISYDIGTINPGEKKELEICIYIDENKKTMQYKHCFSLLFIVRLNTNIKYNTTTSVFNYVRIVIATILFNTYNIKTNL